MKIVILLVISFVLQRSVAQKTTFSISPLINYKLLFCGYGYDQRFGFYSENQPSLIQNPYYEFGAKRISHRPSINIGVRLLASFLNKKHIVSFEWSQDEVGTMSKTRSFTTTNTTNLPLEVYDTYGIGVNYFQNSFVFDRFSMGYGYLLNQKAKKSKIYFITDLSFTHIKDNRQEWDYIRTSDDNSIYYHNEAKWERTQQVAQLWGGSYFLFGIGFKVDIAISIKSKAIYLFSLESNYRQGFKVMVASEEETLINDNNKLIAFSNSLGSKGSGLYFQISRNFQLYPWKYKQNKIKNIK